MAVNIPPPESEGTVHVAEDIVAVNIPPHTYSLSLKLTQVALKSARSFPLFTVTMQHTTGLYSNKCMRAFRLCCALCATCFADLSRAHIIYKTYYTSRRRVKISPYLTADECNKCFILIGTPPGSFSH